MVTETAYKAAVWRGAGRDLTSPTADIFCRVIDNFGDAGVAWRLASQLALERGFNVRVFIDEPKVLAKIVPKMLTAQDPTIHEWDAASTATPASLVLSTFCCRIHDAYVEAMRTRPRKSVWINVEYLSAEPWVETHHKLPSLRPDGLVEYFFYPGFTEKTGGVLRERNLLPPPGGEGWREGVGAAKHLNEIKMFTASIFAYETECIHGLIAGMNDVGVPAKLVLPFGRLSEKMGLFAPQVFGSVALEPIPFTDQAGYDQLLARCDFNIVRGEDSFVRAQWAAKPFLWHIYPQAENAHTAKLQAWLERFGQCVSTPQFRADLTCFFHAWSAGDASTVRALWPTLYARRHAWQQACALWRARLKCQRDLTTQLIEFANKIASELQS